MSIVTKTGDSGQTSLYSMERVPKSHLRIEAVGTIDELNANLAGLHLEEIQEDLFYLGSILADTRTQEDAVVLDMDLQIMEKQIGDMEGKLPPLKNFILPGGHPDAIRVHIARAVCRRAERIVSQIPGLPKNVLPYLNRLSDYLFMLARKLNHDHGVAETIWKS